MVRNMAMNSETHGQFSDRLSEYLDDELDAEDRASIDAHLATCSDCRRLLDELRRVVTTAQALPPRSPASELWPGVADRISRPRTAGLWSRMSIRHVTFTLPQVAAAMLVIAVLAGGIVWRLRGGGPGTVAAPTSVGLRALPGGATPVDALERPVIASPVSLGEAQYDQAVADLQKVLAAGRGRLDPATVAAIEQSLDTIDHAIAQAREALDNDPANTYLSGHLLETRRRKLDLLRRAATLAAEMN
jgi:putative zinc finger protein